jgi:positive regulator of sigma E activity
LTVHVLKSRQSDITDQGYLFSAVVIYLGNMVVLLVGVPLVTGMGGVSGAFELWLQATRECLTWLGQLAAR